MAAPSPIPAVNERTRLLTPMAILKIAIVLIFVAASGWLLWAHSEWFENPALVKVEVLSWGIWGPAIYILLYAVGPSFLVPGAVMTIAGGLAFGTLWGSVYSLVGADAGALIAFAAGRFLGRSFVEHLIGARFEKLLAQIGRHGFQIVFYLRLVPLIPYNALNLLAGASPITFRDYFWASMIGMVPGTILFAFLGDALWHPTSPRFFLALGLIAVCFAAGELARRRGWLPSST
ncbi:MAG TPA: TVP38/TMEM64 family protein [Candidatus Binataceae bacterium]|nr:TVP38/TMEM64 family protein [Candidatus Binataceae bacterium]